MKKEEADSPFYGLARSWQLPDDYVKGRVLVTMQGQEHLTVENFRGICSYTSEEICIRGGRRKLVISGERLIIDCYSRSELEISGRISRVEFL